MKALTERQQTFFNRIVNNNRKLAMEGKRFAAHHYTYYPWLKKKCHGGRYEEMLLLSALAKKGYITLEAEVNVIGGQWNPKAESYGYSIRETTWYARLNQINNPKEANSNEHI